MVTVEIRNAGSFKVDISGLEKKLKQFLATKTAKPCHVEVAIVDAGEMKRLGKTYLKEESGQPHNVLSFPTAEVGKNFIFPPDGTKRLGEVAVCYPKALAEAKDEGKKADEKICELAQHGIRHLLGIHHK
ncbi:rRNA maturation RNase YbeY [Candidatus Woesebacteria bacterium GWB1_43_5]|uniref:rRNA maturation RNase YbeY n=1 Tax=Candidatus Woesebacteria bacterium GWB1_43_5 TaxID=1802474 RepID=A0A1F7WS70_9BACT|nr:MAG: rRNA maturation RNase YbeY [Candidatus Woesebacteria bacterium GWB1_43_5]